MSREKISEDEKSKTELKLSDESTPYFTFTFLPTKSGERRKVLINGQIYVEEKKGATLGEGNFGTAVVYVKRHNFLNSISRRLSKHKDKIEDRSSLPEKIVVKTQKAGQKDGKYNPKESINEAKMNHSYYHFGCFAGNPESDTEPHHVAMRYFPGCTLRKFPFKSDEEFFKVARTIIGVTNIFHQHGFVHLDLIEDNIVINKISDDKYEVDLIDLAASGKEGEINYLDKLLDKDYEVALLIALLNQCYKTYKEDDKAILFPQEFIQQVKREPANGALVMLTQYLKSQITHNSPEAKQSDSSTEIPRRSISITISPASTVSTSPDTDTHRLSPFPDRVRSMSVSGSASSASPLSSVSPRTDTHKLSASPDPSHFRHVSMSDGPVSSMSTSPDTDTRKLSVSSSLSPPSHESVSPERSKKQVDSYAGGSQSTTFKSASPTRSLAADVDVIETQSKQAITQIQ